MPYNSPIIIINPLQKLYNDIIYDYNCEKNISNMSGTTSDINDIEVRLINSISETGQIGFLKKED